MNLTLDRSPSAALNSLSSRQVTLLLGTLKRHSELLEASHRDARRRTATGETACYLLDYELLRRYMFEVETRTDQVLELEFLFRNSDVIFILGIGTQVELITDVRRRTKLDISLPALHDAESLDHFTRTLQTGTRELFEAELAITSAKARDIAGIDRLRNLLRGRNFMPTTSMTNLRLQPGLFERCRQILNGLRPQQTRNNVADALNVAQVLALRHGGLELYPFILTSSQHLLGSSLNDHLLVNDLDDEEGGGSVEEISRTPLTATYSTIAQACFSTPKELASETNRLILQAASLQAELRNTDGYTDQVAERSDREWQMLVKEARIGPGSLDQLNRFTSFISEPIIRDTQSLYDTIQQNAANLSSQRRRLQTAYSPRRVFDILTGLSRALEAKRAGEELFEGTWEYALAIERSDHRTHFEFRIRDNSDSGSATYLTVEAHSEFVVHRWSTDSDFERILVAFCSAYARQGIEEVVLQLGSADDDDVLEFDVVLPITLSEVLAECNSVTWLRMESDELDLYADIVGPLGVDPVVGVIGGSPNAAHVVALFGDTASRFVFSSWLLPALRNVHHQIRIA